LVNPTSGGICKVDPSDVIQENNEDNNTATDTVLVNAPGSPDLRVTKSNSTDGEGLVGTPFNWNLTVSNTGTADAVFSSTWAILTDTLPEKIENESSKWGGFSASPFRK
jgi:hypothetical protein